MFEELHDRAKESLYWKDFNPSFLGDACKSILDLDRALMKYFYSLPKETRHKNAQFILVDSLCHNMRALMIRLTRKPQEELLGEDILVLQSYLQNLHLLVDGIIPDEPFGLNPIGNKGEYQKLKSVLNEDGETYRAVQVISPNEVSGVIDYLKERLSTWFRGDSESFKDIQKEYQDEIDLLESGQKLTKWFKIES